MLRARSTGTAEWRRTGACTRRTRSGSCNQRLARTNGTSINRLAGDGRGGRRPGNSRSWRRRLGRHRGSGSRKLGDQVRARRNNRAGCRLTGERAAALLLRRGRSRRSVAGSWPLRFSRSLGAPRNDVRTLDDRLVAGCRPLALGRRRRKWRTGAREHLAWLGSGRARSGKWLWRRGNRTARSNHNGRRRLMSVRLRLGRRRGKLRPRRFRGARGLGSPRWDVSADGRMNRAPGQRRADRQRWSARRNRGCHGRFRRLWLSSGRLCRLDARALGPGLRVSDRMADGPFILGVLGTEIVVSFNRLRFFRRRASLRLGFEVGSIESIQAAQLDGYVLIDGAGMRLFFLHAQFG